jgi:hypothetical protein
MIKIKRTDIMIKIKLRFVSLLVIICISQSEIVFGQNHPSGIYVDVTTSSNKMIFYTTNGINYVISNEYSYVTDSGKIISGVRVYGTHRTKNTLNYISGPFAIYGPEGYFFDKDGKEYYYDELEASYGSNTETDPLDTLSFLYVKKSDLPVGWELKPESRIGELGVINKKHLYEIIRVADIYKIDIKGNAYIYIKGQKGSDDFFGEYIIAESDFLQLNISKIGKNDISDLKGKILQLFFKWESGQLPGYLRHDGIFIASSDLPMDQILPVLDSKENKNNIPYEMIILNENLSTESKFKSPKPRK